MKLYFKTPQKFYQQFAEIELKCQEKIGSAWLKKALTKSSYKNLQVLSTIYKLYGYNFWWKGLDLQ